MGTHGEGAKIIARTDAFQHRHRGSHLERDLLSAHRLSVYHRAVALPAADTGERGIEE